MAGLWRLLLVFSSITGMKCIAGLPQGMPAVPSAALCSAISDRVDCSSGWKDITSELCSGRGCCYTGNPSNGTPSCFYGVEGVATEVVHMINSNHFDAGYADITANVVNEYFDSYFPRAAKVGAELRALPAATPGAGPLRWMTFSYLISLYFDCPSGMGLHCPSDEAKANVTKAIGAGDIVWPAFPHNAELATGDAAMLTFGVKLSRDLASQLGAEIPTVVSTRDVPGMPKAAIGILARAGVTGLSEGMNGRMVPVNVPPAFSWSDGNVTMPTLWHWGGYGDLGSPGGVIRIPGSKHALAYCWRGDNAGPPESTAEVLNNAKGLVKDFSGKTVQVVSSSLHRYVKAVSDESVEGVSPWAGLPRISQDLSDTWIWGVGSDPVKVQRTRAIHRARTACEQVSNGHCGSDDKPYGNFSRLTIKNMEHTWGVSVSHYGPVADTHWSNAEFHKDLADGQPNLKYMVKSWVEQRDYGINFPLQGLPVDHPVKLQVTKEIADLTVDATPDTSALERILDPSAVIRMGDVNVSLATDGSIVRIEDDVGKWASTANPLALLRYQTLDLDDFKKWQADYLIAGSGGTNEYGKPDSFMKANPTPTHQLQAGSLKSAWRNGAEELLVQVVFADALVRDYGAPSEAWIRYAFTTKHELDVDLLLFNKTATRMPEAMFMTFRPTGSVDGKWEHAVLGEWSDPLDVAYGAARGLHYTSEDGVRLTSKDGATSVQVMSIDTGLLRWDAPLPFPTPLHTQPDMSEGASYCLFNNIWNTNYPDWMPFDAVGKNLRYRFRVLLSSLHSGNTSGSVLTYV